MFTLSDFRQALLTEFPDLFDEADEIGPATLQIGLFGAFTQEAKGRADWDTYRRSAALVEQYLRNANPELRNAISVCYLERLDFQGVRGPEAWRLLGSMLQNAWEAIAAANARAKSRSAKQRG